MSYAGSILDKLIVHVKATDAAFEATRGVNLIATLNGEDFPHVFAYEPKVDKARLPFRQYRVSGSFRITIVTKGETQEQLLVRVDAIVALLEGDITLTGDIDDLAVSYELLEDPRDGKKAVFITVSTEGIE